MNRHLLSVFLLILISCNSNDPQDCESIFKGKDRKIIPSSENIDHEVSIDNGPFYKCSGDGGIVHCGDYKVFITSPRWKNVSHDHIYDKKDNIYLMRNTHYDGVESCRKISIDRYKVERIDLYISELKGEFISGSTSWEGSRYDRKTTSSYEVRVETPLK